MLGELELPASLVPVPLSVEELSMTVTVTEDAVTDGADIIEAFEDSTALGSPQLVVSASSLVMPMRLRVLSLISPVNLSSIQSLHFCEASQVFLVMPTM